MSGNYTERLNSIPILKCKCHDLPPHYSDYTSSSLGIDKTEGRFADVTLEICKHCERKWINYLVEYEGTSRSGRYYRGLISDIALSKLTPETAVEHLEKLDWYIFGGSHFSSGGIYGRGKVETGLFG